MIFSTRSSKNVLIVVNVLLYEYRKPSSKLISEANQNKGKKKTEEVNEIDTSTQWFEFSGPIVERSNSVQKESRIYLKTAFNRYVDLLLPTLLRGSSN